MNPEQAAEKYHWCKYDKATNIVELYLDNFMLSGLRICEAKFYLEHLLWIKPKYETVGTPRTDGKIFRKPWFFDFGEYIHWCLEQFYKYQKLYGKAPDIMEWLLTCRVNWDAMKMDEYANSANKTD